MQNQKYIPVHCSFYDHLEAFATTQKSVKINYLDADYKKIIHQKIKVKDLQTKNGEEFMIFEEIENAESDKQKIKIRLDRLINIDGIEVPKNGESCIL
jgi:Rho-binding antiterminator